MTTALVGKKFVIGDDFELPQNSEIVLDTSSLDFILSGLEDTYGADKAVKITFEVKNISRVEINEIDYALDYDVDLNLKFTVDNEVAVEMTLEEMNLNSPISMVSPTALSMRIDSFLLKELRVDQSITG